VWEAGADLVIDAMFRDSCWQPDGTEVAVHEYVLDARVDRETGRSKGFGFVEMSSTAEAQQALSMFNGYSLDRRQLTVNEARPRAPRPVAGL
jgi:hypothetical protein